MPTTEEINAAILELRDTVDRWRDNPNPIQVAGSPVITETIWNSARNLQELCETAQIPNESWHTVLAVDEFLTELTKWGKAWDSPDEFVAPDGSQSLWRAYDRMLIAMAPRVRRPIESVASLIRQKVPFRQIAKMYRWLTPLGEPDVQKVNEEARAPGTHFDPDNFMLPADSEREDELAERWKTRAVAMAQKDVDRQIAASKPRETVDDLIRQKLTIRQIRKIWPEKSIEEVQAVGREIGETIADEVNLHAYKRTRTPTEELEDAEREAAETTEYEESLEQADHHPEVEDIALRIAALSEDGMKPGKIADLLTREGIPNVSPQSVGRTLARRRREMAEESK